MLGSYIKQLSLIICLLSKNWEYTVVKLSGLVHILTNMVTGRIKNDKGCYICSVIFCQIWKYGALFMLVMEQ